MVNDLSKENIENLVQIVNKSIKVGIDHIVIKDITNLTEREILLLEEALNKTSRII
ncbi:hypothetical protein [Clostridium sp. Ade.TY]|uniref:hypothetical protein n=1 Tax=Clostridium sp. Ade.TY TaxID=1391647 RepID=UPI00040A0996|nr:hypothetical protein [Clostridium sp. Ade.TY]